MDGVEAGRPFTIEYRIVHRDGEVRWVLERGQAKDAGDGRRWLDGAIFDVMARRAAEQAPRARIALDGVVRPACWKLTRLLAARVTVTYDP